VEIENAWQNVMGHSIISQIPGFHESSFVRLALFAYGAFILVPFFAMLYAYPTRRLTWVDYDLDGGMPDEYRTPYNCTPTQHGPVLLVLSSLARFEAVTFQAVMYATGFMDSIMDPQVRVTEFYTRKYQYLQMLRSELDRAVARFVLIGFLQDSLQTNFQTTLVGVLWGVSQHLDRQLFGSVVLCFLSTLVSVGDVVDVVKLVLNYRQHKGDFDRHEAALFAHLEWRFAWFCVFLFIFLFFSLWSGAKLVALFVCDSHLWNFHPIMMLFQENVELGCVALPSAA
jgi:hypothetical protein